jgi:hypothetical protein
MVLYLHIFISAAKAGCGTSLVNANVAVTKNCSEDECHNRSMIADPSWLSSTEGSHDCVDLCAGPSKEIIDFTCFNGQEQWLTFGGQLDYAVPSPEVNTGGWLDKLQQQLGRRRPTAAALVSLIGSRF